MIGTPAYLNRIKAKTVKKLLSLVFRSLLCVDDGVATTRDFVEAVAIENPYEENERFETNNGKLIFSLGDDD